MAQADFNVANQSFPAARADLNNQLLALATNSSGASAPSTTYPYMQWADTTGGILYLRNAANSGWNSLFSLDGATHYAAYITQRVDNGALVINGGSTGGANIELYGPSHATVPNAAIYDAVTHTFRSVDGVTQYGLLNASGFDVGGPGTSPAVLQLGAGATGNRYAYIDLIGDTTYSDYGLRIIRNNTGANATSSIEHRGTGTLSLNAIDGANVGIATSNVIRFYVDGASGVSVASYGISGTITRGTAVTPGAVTSVTFSSIPSWVKQVTLHFSGISLSGTDHFLIRLSTGGTFASTGYNSSSNFTTVAGATGGTSSTAGAVLFGNATANTLTGSYTFTNITGNTWIGTGLHIYDNDAQFVGTEASKVTLSGTLDGIRILPSGANTFDAGTINITYSG